MEIDQVPKPHSLTNKPLVEAIFELRWQLQQPDKSLPPHDPAFRIALGRYYDQVRKDYPYVQDLPSAQVPEDMTAYTVRHQFRSAKNQWPLTQIGPGILTVNDTEGYMWDSFEPRLLKAVNAMYAAYPTDVSPFDPVRVQLRYIDAIPFDPSKNSPTQFLKNFLHTSVTVDPRLFNGSEKVVEPVGMNLHLRFPLEKPDGVGMLVFADGYHGKCPSIIMEIMIRSEEGNVPQDIEQFKTWLADAHAVVDKWFFALCRGELMKRFGGEVCDS